jgi:hypothetical protein
MGVKLLDGTCAPQQPVRVHFARLSIAATILLSSFGCNAGGGAFTTKLASDFAPAHHTVSVLGVYQDGRMSLDSWAVLGPYLTPALGSAPCAVGYESLATTNQELANAIDEYARDEGPTGNLLTQLAPAARGDLILVVTLAGKLPKPQSEDEAAAHPAPVNNSMGSSRHRGRHAAPAEAAADDNQLDISASLFSVAQGHPVALVALQYRGTSQKDALTRFAQELARATPDLKCTGWDFSVPIDPKRLVPSSAELSAPHE